MGHLHSSIITMCFKLVHSKIARANGNGLIVSVSKPLLLLLCLKLCLMLSVLSLPKLNFGSFHKYPPTYKNFYLANKNSLSRISLMTTFLDFFYQEIKTHKWKNFSRTTAQHPYGLVPVLLYGWSLQKWVLFLKADDGHTHFLRKKKTFLRWMIENHQLRGS